MWDIIYFFTPKCKPLQANKRTKSLKILHPLLPFVITLPSAPPLAPTGSPRHLFFTTSRDWLFNFMFGQSYAMSICWFTHARHLNVLSSFSSPLIPLCLLCNQQLQKLGGNGITAYSRSTNSTRKVAFFCNLPAFSPLIIIFITLAFPLNTLNNSPF